MPAKLILFRHGELEPHFQNKFIGSSDVPLSDVGRRQIIRFRPFIQQHRGALFLYSPLQRAEESFRLATDGLSVKARADENLREIDFGAWDGASFLEIQEQFPNKYSQWQIWSPEFAYPGGDSHQSFIKRIKTFAHKVRGLQDETVIVFSHGGVIMFLICELLGLEPSNYKSFRVRRGSRTTFDLSRGGGMLEEINFVPE